MCNREKILLILFILTVGGLCAYLDNVFGVASVVALSVVPVISLRKEDIPDIKLDALYKRTKNGKSLSIVEALEEAELEKGFKPSVELSSVSDAWSRQIFKSGIDLKSHAYLSDSFFATSTNRILFPEYVRRKFLEGMKLRKRELGIDEIVAIKSTIDGEGAKQQYVEFPEDAKMSLIAEGSEIPTTSVKTMEGYVPIFKVGSKVVFTYEVLRRMTLVRAGNIFNSLGQKVSRQYTQRALQIFREGDGNFNPITPIETATTTWTYSDLIQFLYGDFAPGYEPSHVVVNPAFFIKLFTDKTNFPQLQSPGILEQFLKSGEQQDLLGVTWRLHDSVPDNQIYAFDRRQLLEFYTESNSDIVETDKVISNQTEFSTITKSIGFGIIDKKARQIKKLKE